MKAVLGMFDFSGWEMHVLFLGVRDYLRMYASPRLEPHKQYM